MIDPAKRFAVIELGVGDRVPPDAIAHGSWAALGPLLFDTRPLTAALELAARTVTLAEQEHGRQAGEQQIVADGVATLVDGLTQLRQRVDALARSQADRRRLDAASEVARELLEIPADNRPRLVSAIKRPGHPANCIACAVAARAPERLSASEREDQGNLPRELNIGAPPDPGTDPEFDPAQLGKPPDFDQHATRPRSRWLKEVPQPCLIPCINCVMRSRGSTK